MKRSKGFIDLEYLLNLWIDTSKSDDQTFQELYELLSARSDIEIVRSEFENSLVFSFMHEGEKYYFKYSRQAFPESELFAHQAARLLDINSVQYDLASIGNYKGVISKDYKNDHAVCTTGIDVLLDAADEKDGKARDALKFSQKRKNSLYSIRAALEKRHEGRYDCCEMVSKLMDQIVDIFILDILLGNPDHSPLNWSLLEYDDDRIEIMPDFDNTPIFAFRKTHIELPSGASNDHFHDPKILLSETLREFVEIYPEYVNHLKEKLWILSRDSVEEIFVQIKKLTNCQVPRAIREYFYERCREQLGFLMKALGMEDLPVTKEVPLCQILSQTNKKGLSHGEIGITIITPFDVIHAVSVNRAFCLHDTLFEDVFLRLYGGELDEISPYSITIRHIIVDPKQRTSIAYVPKYVTPFEYENLKSILKTVQDSGFDFSSKFGEFDPIEKKFNYYGYDEFEGAEILDHIEENGFIINYDWPFERIDSLEKLEKSIS